MVASCTNFCILSFGVNMISMILYRSLHNHVLEDKNTICLNSVAVQQTVILRRLNVYKTVQNYGQF